MRKITRVSETKRGRFALFSDEEFLFSIDAETLAKHEICEGSSVDEEELSSLRRDSDTRKAKDAALRYLSVRAHGQQELYDKLCRRFDPHSAAAAVAGMCDVQLMDDEVFAEEKVKGLVHRGKSRREISRQLAQLGIAKDVAQRVMQQWCADDAETAAAIVRKGYMEKLHSGEREKVLAALARRGFSYADSQAAIEAAGMEEDEPVW